VFHVEDGVALPQQQQRAQPSTPRFRLTFCSCFANNVCSRSNGNGYGGGYGGGGGGYGGGSYGGGGYGGGAGGDRMGALGSGLKNQEWGMCYHQLDSFAPANFS
jgi:hypothetical protein